MAQLATNPFLLSVLTVLLVTVAGCVWYLISVKRHAAALKDELTALQCRLEEALKEAVVAREQARQAEFLREELAVRDTSIAQLRATETELKVQLAGQQARFTEELRSAEEKITLLKEARQQLMTEFQNLANKIFEEKSEKFNQQSKQSLDGALNPLREQLKDFKKKVEDVYDKESRERISLVAELGQLKELNRQMSKEALNLTKALKGDNKAQGNWGEVILERVLEDSGLHKGREYDIQVSLSAKDGEPRKQPDVIVHLPESKDIVIDAKVSLVHYERYCSSDDEEERKNALKQHASSVRGHINRLSFKDYENLEGIRTLDFVFIFIPIEAAFMAAFEFDQSMFKEAYEKNIIVVGPTTLLATLRTVQSIWRYERQNKNAEEIARQAGALHDKFVGFIADLEDVGKYLERAGKSHQEAIQKLSQGRGNLVSSVQKLEKLGAKAKKRLPDMEMDDTISSDQTEAEDYLLDYEPEIKTPQ